MATHRVLVVMQTPDFILWERGALVDYHGEPDWKLEPLDLAEREIWAASVAKPEEVLIENRRRGITGWFGENESPLPPGMLVPGLKRLPPSGPPGAW